MAVPVFKPKRSNTASSIPTTSNLVDGELAVNSADKKIFLRDGASIIEIANASTISEGNTYYVSTSGSDSNTGTTLDKAFLTVKQALSVATSGSTIRIGSGSFSEIFPLTIPAGVNVKGAGIRSTVIKPTTGTKTNDCFLLNGETTVEDLTIADMFEPGYAFRFATSMKTTTRSPYIQRVTVLNKGSTTSSTDPYGFSTVHNPTSTYKAGRGVLIDGSVVDATTLEPAMLFNECTFICPNNVGLEMTNGARTEWVNCFTYFCDKAISATSGSTGLGGTGKTRVKISGISGAGSPTANDLLYYFDETSKSGTYSRTTTTVTITFNSHGLTNGDRIYADFTSGTAPDGIYTISNVTTNTFDLTTATSGTTSGNVTYKKALAYGTISTYSSGTVTLTGKGTGTFQTAASRSGKVVTAYGDAKLSTAQFKFGTASLSLDGTGDYARSEGGTDFSFAGNLTAECWVYPTSTSGSKYLFTLGTETTGRYNLALVNGVVTGNFYGSSSTTFGGSISTNTWTHIALVRSGSTITVYVNGTALGTTETNSSTIGNTGQLTIGADTSGSSGFTGYIDTFRLSDSARYTATFTPATSAFTSDSNTKLLLHFDGDSGSTQFTDSTLVVQDVRLVAAASDGSTSLLTATTITLADYQQFGASMRSIGSAAIFGNSGVNADGLGVNLRLFAFNFGHIGSGGDFSQDESLVNQANEVIILNGAKVGFVSIDQGGDFRVGNSFYVNEEKGVVSFGGQSFNVSSLSNLTITDGTNSTALTPTSITSGGIQLSSNTISTTSGNLTINPAGTSLTTVEGNLTVNGTLTASSSTISGISAGDSQVAITDTGANGTITLQADGVGVQTVTSTGTSHIGAFIVRAAANQDGVHLLGRAGGTGNFEVTITPTTLSADRTLTLADANTTLTAGTMAALGSTQTFTGINTLSPTARTSGSASYFTLTTPADTTLTASTESIGANFTAATRQFSVGTLTLQRERVFDAPTYGFTAASTLATAVNVDIATPVAGTNATITNAYALRSGNALFTGNVNISGLTALQAVFTDVNKNLVSVATTGSGSVVLANTPTLVTPVLGAATGTSLTLSGTSTSTLRLTGPTPVGPTTNDGFGFAAIGASLGFNDKNKILTAVANIDDYSQMILQNLSSGVGASSDFVVNNDRVGGTSIYGDFGINSSAFAGGGAFGDVDGTYVYGAGGTLTVGTLGAQDFKIGTNNVVRFTLTSAGLIDHVGTSITTRAAATQDGVTLLGRAGGTGSFDAILTPTTLTADRTLTLPDATTTLVGTDVSQNLTNKILTTRAGTATAGTAPIKLTSGTNLTAAEAGAIEYDGTYLYSTETTTSGRGHVPSKQTFRLAADGSNVTTGLFFGTTSAINLAAASVYEIVFWAVGTKNTAGTITWQITSSSAPTRISAQYVSSAITAITGTGAPPTGTAGASAATTATFAATGSITNNAVITHRFTVYVLTNLATTLNLNISAMSAGTITPLAGSYYTVERISGTTGSFA